MSVRSIACAVTSLAVAGTVSMFPVAAIAKPTAQSAHCASEAKREGLTGAKRAAFVKSCLKGSGAPPGPTAPTVATKEGQAVTKPSGTDPATRSKQCNAEADRKGLAAKDRNAFRLSCLATAGPVSEGETGTVQPHPGKAIGGIGVNNYKRDATPAKSAPAENPPAAAKPKG